MPPLLSFPAIRVAAAALLLTVPPPAISAEDLVGELRSRLRIANRELENLRGSLHDALVELADRNERIETLEAALLEDGDTVAPLSESEPPLTKTEEKPRPASPAAPVPKTVPEAGDDHFEVAYGENSAVSYEGREAALGWLRTRIGHDPDFAVQVVGTANDSRYPDANEAIADNRAKFLVAYLVMNGIPRTSIVSVDGRASEKAEKAGRSVVLQAVDREAHTSVAESP